MARRFRLLEDAEGRLSEEGLTAAAGALDAAGDTTMAQALRTELGLGPKLTCSICHFAGVKEDEQSAHARMHAEGGHPGATFTPSA